MKKRRQTLDSNRQQKVIVFQAKSGAIELRGDFVAETIWATQAQIVDLFGVDQSVVSRHIKNIFRDGEIAEESNMQKMHIANSDKPITAYSLDVVLGVGYRTNSRVAIEFRKWATKTLRQYIVRGFTINPKAIKYNYTQFQKAVENIRALVPNESLVDHASVIELISAFASTWLSLDAYDKNELSVKGVTKKSVTITAEQLSAALREFKAVLLKKKEATALFGNERTKGSIEGIVGNVMQSLGGEAVYATVEEKAAHLLYFIIKNHPFSDGNKRSGAYAFIWFLHRAGALDRSTMTPQALTSLTLLIAESNPKDKDRVTSLVLHLLRQK